MDGLSTITQKGQVVIPASIRRALGLEPSTRVSFEIKEGGIFVKPAPTVDEMFGIIKSKRHVSKREYKKAIAKAVVEKYLRRQ